MLEYVLHITTREAWAQAQRLGSYRADLEREGFIHFSDLDQVVEVANVLFHGRHDLVLLCVSPEKLHAQLRSFGTPEPYPHLYDPLNLDAVAKVVDFPPHTDGTFQHLEQNGTPQGCEVPAYRACPRLGQDGTYRACPLPTDISSSVTP